VELMKQLPGALLPWFEENKRELPWRKDKEPYHVWLSEIMLQQTRVEAVKGYYARFLEALPTVQALAQADDGLLLKLWEGLGYYNRARNLKKAAVEIVTRYGGEFPKKYEEILSLPGIGEYTAGAIASICFGQPTPAVDGNVLRVIARICNEDTPIDTPAYKKSVQARLADIYPENAGEFTQALMELGATLCGPNWAPRCGECPCASFCKAHAAGTAQHLPVKAPKKDKKQEKRTVFILSCYERYALCRRPEKGLLAGLWEFPNVPGALTMQEGITVIESWGLKPVQLLKKVQRQHIFTHIRWEMTGLYVEVKEPLGGFVWYTAEEIEAQAALPTAFRQFWEEFNHV